MANYQFAICVLLDQGLILWEPLMSVSCHPGCRVPRGCSVNKLTCDPSWTFLVSWGMIINGATLWDSPG